MTCAPTTAVCVTVTPGASELEYHQTPPCAGLGARANQTDPRTEAAAGAPAAASRFGGGGWSFKRDHWRYTASVPVMLMEIGRVGGMRGCLGERRY